MASVTSKVLHLTFPDASIRSNDTVPGIVVPVEIFILPFTSKSLQVIFSLAVKFLKKASPFASILK